MEGTIEILRSCRTSSVVPTSKISYSPAVLRLELTRGAVLLGSAVKNCNIIITCNVGGWPDGLNNLCNLKFVRVVDVTCWRERKVGIRMSLSARKVTIEVDRLL